MAVYRPPYHCPFCGELIREVHEDQSFYPEAFRKFGDTFIGYELHACTPKTSIATNHTEPIKNIP